MSIKQNVIKYVTLSTIINQFITLFNLQL